MKKLFSRLLVVFATLAVACEPFGSNSSKDDVTESLELTSSPKIRVGMQGGTELITYKLSAKTSGELVVKVINDELITAFDTTIGGIISLTISANPTSELREGIVSVSYGASSFTVKVEQEGNPNAPSDACIVVANQFHGSYFGETLGEGIGHYWIILSKDGFAQDGSAKVGGEFFRVEFVGPAAQDPNNARIPDGVYQYDLSNSLMKFTIPNLGNSDYTYVDQYLEGWATPYTNATLTVEGDKITLEAVVEETEYLVTYEGDYTLRYNPISEYISTLDKDCTIDLSDCVGSAKCYNDNWYCGYCNWYIVFEDKDGWNQGTYLVLELLTDSNLNGSSGFEGHYVGLGVDAEDSTLPLFGSYGFISGHRMSSEASYLLGSLYQLYKNGTPIEQAPLRGGEIDITANSDGTYTIVINATDDAEPAHKVKLNWTGRL